MGGDPAPPTRFEPKPIDGNFSEDASAASSAADAFGGELDGFGLALKETDAEDDDKMGGDPAPPTRFEPEPSDGNFSKDASAAVEFRSELGADSEDATSDGGPPVDALFGSGLELKETNLKEDRGESGGELTYIRHSGASCIRSKYSLRGSWLRVFMVLMVLLASVPCTFAEPENYVSFIARRWHQTIPFIKKY